MEANPWDTLAKRKYPLLIIATGLVVFFNSFFRDFVWDEKILFQNVGLYDIHNFFSFFGHNLISGSGYYRPLFILYYAVLFALFPNQTFFIHVSQVAMHIANTLLIFALFRKFFTKNLAFVLSLIFLVHPIQVEAVIYDNPLFFLFSIGGLMLVLKKQHSFKTWILVGLLFLLALLTKELAVLFIILAFVYTYLFEYKKIRPFALTSGIDFLVYIFLRIIGGGFFLSSVGVSAIGFLPLQNRLVMIPQMFFFYIKTFFFPATLVIDQQWVITHVTFSNFFLPLLLSFLVIGAFILAAFIIWKRRKEDRAQFIFFAIWFFLGIASVMQIIPLDMTVADRWFYIPMVGLLGMIGVFVTAVKPYVSKNNIHLAFSLILIAFLSIRTILRNNDWTNAMTLYSHDAKLTNSFDLENNLATELLAAGEIDTAILHEKKSVALLPNEINTNNLGKLYEEKGEFALAKEYYLRSLEFVRSSPTVSHHPNNYLFYAEFLTVHGNPSEAVSFITWSLKAYPKLADLWMYLAIAEYRLKDTVATEKAIGTAVLYYPSSEMLYVQHQILNKLPIDVESPYDKKTIHLE